MKNILSKEEKIHADWVKCSVCGELTKTGMKQTRMYKQPNGEMITVNAYMCPKCIKRGELWPGVKPHNHMSQKEINKEIERIVNIN